VARAVTCEQFSGLNRRLPRCTVLEERISSECFGTREPAAIVIVHPDHQLIID
jgi:hypothetical protein